MHQRKRTKSLIQLEKSSVDGGNKMKEDNFIRISSIIQQLKSISNNMKIEQQLPAESEHLDEIIQTLKKIWGDERS